MARLKKVIKCSIASRVSKTEIEYTTGMELLDNMQKQICELVESGCKLENITEDGEGHPIGFSKTPLGRAYMNLESTRKAFERFTESEIVVDRKSLEMLCLEWMFLGVQVGIFNGQSKAGSGSSKDKALAKRVFDVEQRKSERQIGQNAMGRIIKSVFDQFKSELEAKGEHKAALQYKISDRTAKDWAKEFMESP